MSNEYEYKIEYEADKKSGKVTATIPELNHVSSFGNTFAEAEANVKEAVLCYMEAMANERQKVSKPSFTTEGTYLKFFIPQFAR